MLFYAKLTNIFCWLLSFQVFSVLSHGYDCNFFLTSNKKSVIFLLPAALNLLLATITMVISFILNKPGHRFRIVLKTVSMQPLLIYCSWHVSWKLFAVSALKLITSIYFIIVNIFQSCNFDISSALHKLLEMAVQCIQKDTGLEAKSLEF